MGEERNGGIFPANPTGYFKIVHILSEYIFSLIQATADPISNLMAQGINGTTLPGPCDSPVVSCKHCLRVVCISYFK